MSGFWLSEEQEAIVESVARLCAQFDADYWRRTDETGDFPEEFVAAMAAGGWLGTAMPAEFGGAGLGLTEAALVMQAVAQSGAGLALLARTSGAPTWPPWGQQVAPRLATASPDRVRPNLPVA